MTADVSPPDGPRRAPQEPHDRRDPHLDPDDRSPFGDRADQPWSPYPVQDWATLGWPSTGADRLDDGRFDGTEPPPLDPYADNLWLDPARRSDPVVHEVDPDWAPPSSLPRWAPAVIIALVFALASTGLWAVAHTSAGTEPPSSAYLPADGASWYADIDRGLGITHGQTINESTRLGALEVSQAVNFDLGSKLLGALGGTSDELGGARAWRVTSTEIGSGASDQQRVRVYRTDDGVLLMADSGPAGAEVYTPALRELPADPKPGDQWQSSGKTLEGQNYLSDFTAAAGDGDCLDVTGSIAYSGATTGSGTEVQVVRTWCPGRGVTRSSERIGGAAVTEVIIDPAPPSVGAGRITLSDVAAPWRDPVEWSATTTQVHAAEPGFGDATLPSLPTPVPPVVTASGAVVRAVVQGSDLVVLDPPSTPGGNWQVIRRLHPGGAITMLASYGDLVVVGTADRRLVAYRPDGQRAWQTDTDDLVTTPPARSGDAIAAVSASGEVQMIDLATGTLRWRVDRRADVSAPTAADGDVVLVADRSRTLTALSAVDGSEIWRAGTEGTVEAMIINGDRLQVVDGSNLDTRVLADGTLTARHPIPGLYRALRTVGDLTVLAGTTVTEAVDRSGRLVWTRRGYDDLTTDGTVAIGWTDTTGEVLSADGQVRHSYDLGPARQSEVRQFLRYRQGVVVASTVYNDLQVWS